MPSALGINWSDAQWSVIHNGAGIDNISLLDALSDAELSQVLTGWSYQNKSAPYENTVISEISAFFGNTANMPVTRYVYRTYGGIPNYGMQGNGWSDRDLIFYTRAYYYNMFPMPAADPSNCTVFQSTIAAVQNEISAIDKRHLPGGDLADDNVYKDWSDPLQEILTDLNAAYGQLDCDTAIANQQQAAQIQTVEQVASAATSTTAGSTATATNNILNYVLMGAGGLLFIIAIVIVFHKNKPA